MDGGKSKGKKEEMPDIPDNIKQFRFVIRHIKENIMNTTEKYKYDENIQDLHSLDSVLRRIKQLGIFINMILDNASNINNKGADDVYKHFLGSAIDLTKLTDDEKDLCRHYVKLDIFMYPYIQRPAHINSQVTK